MSDSHDDNNQDDPPVVEVTGDDANDPVKDPVLAALIAKQVEASIKDFKSKVDKAYGERDALQLKVAEFEKAQRDAELKRLQDEGKFKEAFELELAEEKARNKALEKTNIELTRDLSLKSSLSLFPFRNKNAQEMAFKDIVGSLVRNESGEWVHKSGASIEAYVKTFAEHEDNAFLLKPKISRGSGQQETQQEERDSKPKSIFELTPEEIADRAAKGTLRRRRN